MRHLGTLKKWDDRRGFGFIETPDGQEYFAHISAFKGLHGRPYSGLPVRFQGAVTGSARFQATQVVPLAASRWRPVARASMAPVGLAVAVVMLGVLANGLPPLLLLPYLVLSPLSLVLYGLDKHRAVTGGRRVPERTLLIIDMLGGWPGGGLARQWFRHKTIKPGFRVAFSLAVILNLAAVLGTGSVAGQSPNRLAQAVLHCVADGCPSSAGTLFRTLKEALGSLSLP